LRWLGRDRRGFDLSIVFAMSIRAATATAPPWLCSRPAESSRSRYRRLADARRHAEGSFARCSASGRVAAKLLAAVASVQRLIETFNQDLPVDGLAQETYCPGLHRSRPNVLFVEGRDENNGRAVTLGNQQALQLDTAHARHLHVSNHARRIM
jgi:hypothetical protein